MRFKDKKDVPELSYNIALVLEKQGKSAEAIAQYGTFQTAFAKDTRVPDTRRLEVKYRQYLLDRKLKNASDQEKIAKDIIATFPKLKEEEKKNDRSMLAFAHTRFVGLEPTFKAYSDMKFKKLATFKTDLAAKQKKLAELEASYT